ncbi:MULTISPECIES: chemotaxis protein CheA [Rhodobacterales]|uniref:chemotaxis protein CheA n=1 Tax=Rhodobacterales TaxID=204455 RepID=UPI00215DBE4C|nr:MULTISPECIES: chemotaxis protein CheA [Rhodobacterales]MDO6590192.1 chemotaxis protein CheA [Yoonia sp. 1_MG-2023]
MGELIINQSVISQRLEKAAIPNSSDLFADLDDYKLLAREIQEGVMAIRAQPVKPLFQRMLRIAREAADGTGKDVAIVTHGENTEVDKTVVERLADPLTHMIRNAIDHGIEAPEQRKAAGKPEQGVLTLTASQRSGSIVIEIADDGAGLNRTRIRAIAVEKGLIPADATLSEQEIDQLLFAPGFSTATEITNLSGRGVGMDVVKTAITTLGGRVAITSVPGKGTTFSITLPLTLAVMDGMIINVGGQTMVVPISSILESIRPNTSDISRIGLHGELLRIRGEYVPIVDLADRLGHPRDKRTMTERVLLLIQTEAVPQCALAVDDIFDQRQVVVKSMQGNYGAISGISGATILGDGKIALIIDPDAIALNAAPRNFEEEALHVAAT